MADNIRLSFPREPDSVPAARAVLARFEDRLDAGALYDASLCLSELVTNAVQHPAAEAGDELELELILSDEWLRVQVLDPGGGFRPGAPTEGDERGWGLFIVDQLSARWGTMPGERTAIWFEIERGEGEPASEGASGRYAGESGRGDPRDELARAVARPRLRPAIQ